MSGILSLKVLSVAALFLLYASGVNAGIILPSGLAPGSQYEIAFITSGGINATSSSITTYNTFATNQAAQDAQLPSGLSWHAIVSTASVGANANAPSVGSIPVYDTQGHLLTNPGQSLYQFSNATPGLFGIEYDQNGNLVQNNANISGTPEPVIWTGSTDAGTIANALGTSNPTLTIASGFGTQWLDSANAAIRQFARRAPDHVIRFAHLRPQLAGDRCPRAVVARNRQHRRLSLAACARRSRQGGTDNSLSVLRSNQRVRPSNR